MLFLVDWQGWMGRQFADLVVEVSKIFNNEIYTNLILWGCLSLSA